MDAVANGSAGHWFGRASIDAEFIIKDRAVHACSGKGVPIGLDDESEAGAAFGVEGGRQFDYFIKFFLVKGGIPFNAVASCDGEVKGWGGRAEDGSMTVGGEEVEILINVVGLDVVGCVDVGRLGSPDFWGDVD